MNIDATSGPGREPARIYEFRPRASARPTPSSEPDSAGITDDARRILQARPTVEAADDIRTERVNELKAAIASGRYQADDREVARRLLDRGF